MGKIEVAWYGRRYIQDLHGKPVKRDDLNGLPWPLVNRFASVAHADFEKVKKALEAKQIPMLSAEVTMIPSTYVKLTGTAASQMLALMNALEEHDDVKNVYANFDIPKEIIENAVSK